MKGQAHTTIRAGDIAAREGRILAAPGTGRFLARGPYALARGNGRTPDGFDAARQGFPG